MGSESSKSDSNSSKSDSDSSSNSGEKGELEKMNDRIENRNTIINRVWIVKKSIRLTDRNIGNNSLVIKKLLIKNLFKSKDYIEMIKPKINIFNIKNYWIGYFKHWAIILELSNGSYVNIQFGKNGFSLEEYNKTEIEGENLLNSILGTWGEEDAPFSFCYLENANYKYEELKLFLQKKKIEESKSCEENGKTYYNACFNNCQHFVCEIEKILFNTIQTYHSFNYYLNEFYDYFFPKIDIDKLKLKYQNEINKKNEELFKLNVKKLNDDKFKSLSINEQKRIKSKIEKWYSRKCEDYLN